MKVSRISRLWRRQRPTGGALPVLPSRAAYALWAESYPPYAHNPLMDVEQAAMRRLMPELAGRVVLDLACGTGRYTRLAAAAGASRVVGADHSLAMLRAGQGEERAEAAMTDLPFPRGVFDVVLGGLALGHLPPEAMPRAIAEIARVLRPGGEAVFSDFHPYLALTGGQRAFTLRDGRAYAVEHHIYFVSDYFAALRDASMILVDIEEPRAALDGKHIPAVLVIRCQRS